MSAFKAYDIRGIYNLDFNKNTVYKIGFYLPELLHSSRILVGRDVRSSSPEIFAALREGITDAGANVVDLGLCTTPMVYWATAKYDFDASVMITASHNPAEYNGLKISKKEALPVGYDNGLNILERWIEERQTVKTKPKGSCSTINITEEYLAFQRQYLGDISDLNVAMDLSNGMASLLVSQLYGNQMHRILDTLDGTFPAHEPNPLEPENRIDLQKLVRQNNADIGVIFDGDADRVMFTDENGTFISPDLMIAVLGHYFFEDQKREGAVLHDIRSSKAVAEYLQQWQNPVTMWRVGRAYAALKLREINGLFGGELAGHYYFRDFYYSDSALMACSILLGIFNRFKKQGLSVSKVMAMVSNYANSGEINFRIEAKQIAMDAVCQHFEHLETPVARYDFDGYRLEFEDWWFNIRPSNTEPYLRFLAEAKSTDKLNKVVDTVRKIIADHCNE